MSNDQGFGKAEFHYRAQHVEGDKFRDGWDRIFGKKKETPAKEETPTTRYFTDGGTMWKFAPGERPQARSRHASRWINSAFNELGDFLMDLHHHAYEISAEEGEP